MFRLWSDGLTAKMGKKMIDSDQNRLKMVSRRSAEKKISKDKDGLINQKLDRTDILVDGLEMQLEQTFYLVDCLKKFNCLLQEDLV